MEWLVYLHLASSWFMIGLVWFVQCVHYPLLRVLPPEAVPAYQLAHMQQVQPLIPLVMLAEGASAALLFQNTPVWWLNLAFLIIVWVTTFGVMVPLHQRLAQGFDADQHKKLLLGNRIRSLAWLAHGVTALLLLKGTLGTLPT